MGSSNVLLAAWASGGMVDALVLGTSRAICGGSSPFLPKYLLITPRHRYALHIVSITLCGIIKSLVNTEIPTLMKKLLPIIIIPGLTAYILLHQMGWANQYRFTCKNMLQATQLVKVTAVSEEQARLKLKTEKDYRQYDFCSYQSMLTDDQASHQQNTWGSKVKQKFEQILQQPMQAQQNPTHQ